MPRSNNPKKTWRYSDEFKVRAVQMSYQEGVQVQQVAEGLGIHPFMLSRWRKEYREGRFKGRGRRRMGVKKGKDSPSTQELSELARLKKENARLRKENDILKKWQRYLAERHQSDLNSSKSTDES
jgi:transposase